MTIQYLPEGSKHTDKPKVIKDVFLISQQDWGIYVCTSSKKGNGAEECYAIKNGNEILVMPEQRGKNSYEN